MLFMTGLRKDVVILNGMVIDNNIRGVTAADHFSPNTTGTNSGAMQAVPIMTGNMPSDMIPRDLPR
jgi:hypothetical protein